MGTNNQCWRKTLPKTTVFCSPCVWRIARELASGEQTLDFDWPSSDISPETHMEEKKKVKKKRENSTGKGMNNCKL
jgi:hypothetical protein